MNVHKNARLTPKDWDLLVKIIIIDGLHPKVAA